MDVRGLLSRQSTASSTGSDAMLAPGCGNFMEVIHDLYQELEPQICKSYRPNVKREPGKGSDPKADVCGDDNPMKPKPSMKTAKMVVDAVSELKKRRDSNVGLKNKFKDIARRASVQSIDENLSKGASQSLPNLTETES